MSDKITKHPATFLYNDRNDPTCVARMHDRDFGAGSWVELEKGVRKRHPEFFSQYDDPPPEPRSKRKWWQFWRGETNVVYLDEWRKQSTNQR